MNETEPMRPYECHERSHGSRNILSTARAEVQSQVERQPAGLQPK